MTQPTATPAGNTWATSSTSFDIEWYSLRMWFANVTEVQRPPAPAEESEAESGGGTYLPITLPALGFGRLLLHDGVLTGSTAVWDWIDAVTMNTLLPAPMTLTVLYSGEASPDTWTYEGALPIRLSGVRLCEDGQTVAVESIEVAYRQSQGGAD